MRRAAELVDMLKSMSVLERESGPPGSLERAYKDAFKNARRRSGYKLLPTDEQRLILRAAGRCEVSGVEFDPRKYGSHRRPFAPSVDRIDSGVGYVFSNVRLVTVAVNLALNEWGDAVFDRIARGYVSRVLQQESATNLPRDY